MKNKYTLISNITFSMKMAFKQNKKLLITIPVFIILSLIVPIFEATFPAITINLITNNNSIENIFLIFTIILLSFAIINFIYIKFSYYNDIEQTKARMTIGFIDLLEKTTTTDYQNVEPSQKQALLSKASEGISSNWTGLEGVMKNTPKLIISFIGICIYIFLLSFINIFILIILLGMVVLNFILSYFARIYERKKSLEIGQRYKENFYLYNNAISIPAGKDIRAYNLGDWFYRLFKISNKKLFKVNSRIQLLHSFSSLSDSIFLIFRDLLAYTVLIKSYLDGNIDLTTFVFYLGIISSFSNWLNQAVESFNAIASSAIAVNNYRDYLNLKDYFNHQNTSEFPLVSKLNIQFKNVTFSYPDSEKKILDNFSFTIAKGKKIALVGNNGSGKTTIVKLLSGLYQTNSGEITVGDIPIQNINSSNYQDLIGVVFQDINILGLTILSNISATTPESSDYQKVLNCLELAGLKEKILSLKNGVNTYLSQNLSNEGILLSGGEMQKLMLARALYKNAPILILDEPTAALDPLAEAELYQKYADLTKDKTSIFISHRLSSTQFCDEIIFLENGKIVEHGNHQELLSLNGKYAEMFKTQAQYYIEKKEGEDNEKE